MSMFEQASRLKLRFNSRKGLISVEDLWDLPLTQLDELAKELRREVESVAESFIAPAATINPRTQVAFDIVKHVIRTRLDERDAAATAAAKKAKRQQLLEILERKQNAALEGLSVDDLRKMIDEL